MDNMPILGPFTRSSYFFIHLHQNTTQLSAGKLHSLYKIWHFHFAFATPLMSFIANARLASEIKVAGHESIDPVCKKGTRLHTIGCAKDVFKEENFFLALGEEGLTNARCGDIISFLKAIWDLYKRFIFIRFEEGEKFNKINILKVSRTNRPRVGGELKFECDADLH